jgi:hypothetical protein
MTKEWASTKLQNTATKWVLRQWIFLRLGTRGVLSEPSHATVEQKQKMLARPSISPATATARIHLATPAKGAQWTSNMDAANWSQQMPGTKLPYLPRRSGHGIMKSTVWLGPFKHTFPKAINGQMVCHDVKAPSCAESEGPWSSTWETNWPWGHSHGYVSILVVFLRV